jgi:nucleotide-binding universal stress UspA family protein
MKKVIIAFDGNHFSNGAFEFVRDLNDKKQLLATGIFLPLVDYSELLFSLGGIGGPIFYQEAEVENTAVVQKNIDLFKSLCEKNGIEYRVHPDLDRHVISEVKLESRYADLLVVSSELFYENLGTSAQDDYLEDVLHQSECPVMLLPEHYQAPDNVILAYDGSPSSVYAIKQFAYLLPEFKDVPVMLVHAGSDEIPSLEYIEELAARHFSDLTIYKLEIVTNKYFNTWLQDKKSSLVVTGSYGRPAFSEMFKKSFIADTIHNHQLPVFVAHR